MAKQPKREADPHEEALARPSVRTPDSDPGETARLTDLLYGELRRIAKGYLRSEQQGHTLQPTALVHEAFLRLSEQDVLWQNRDQFLAHAAITMRRILVDHARRRSAAKRNAELIVTVNVSSGQEDGDEDRELNLLALDAALSRLATLDARSARVVELRFFGGLSVEEAGRSLGISPKSVKRDWRFARVWLEKELSIQKNEP